MTKRNYRSWELSLDSPVSRSTLWNWKKRGVVFQEHSDTDTRTSLAPVDGQACEFQAECTETSTFHKANTEKPLNPNSDASREKRPSETSETSLDVAHASQPSAPVSTIGDEDTDSDSSTNFSSDSSSSTECHAQATEQDEQLYVGSRITRAESLLLIMGHALKYHGSKEATESLLKVVEAHLPQDTTFPSTKYQFFKYFAAVMELQRAHFYCTECSAYLCEDSADISLAESIACKSCARSTTRDKLFSSWSYFISLDLESQFRGLMEKNESMITVRPPPAYTIGDITGSPAYRALPLTGDDISFTWSTDGVPVFQSSQYSIWPLLLQVNEMPYRDRIQNQILAGLWFGPEKPCMNTFLKPFVDKVNALSTNGFSWTSKSGSEKCSRVFPGPCSVDSVARCQLLNMTQFNGKQGCPWCEHEGEAVEVGRGHCGVYPILEELPPQRTDSTLNAHAKKAEETGEPSGGWRV